VSFNEGVSIDTSRASRGRGGRAGGIAAGGGVGGLLIVLLFVFLGGDPSQLPTGTSPGGGGQEQGAGDLSRCQDAQDANTDVECRIIATENSLDAYWQEALPAAGGSYERPYTVVFEGQTDTGCGAATSAVGPFYCPADISMYFDADFFQVLTDQFGSSGGPLAQEYVVAHEFGHHIQNQLGVLGAAQQDPQGEESGAVRVELMADCLAGVWAHHAATVEDPDTGVPFLQPLTDQDIADALSAASSVGDDRIQERTQGRVNPEAWTHGSSEQRQTWFTTGYSSGDLNSCDTLDAADLG
jgi:predicted metalloprotease